MKAPSLVLIAGGEGQSSPPDRWPTVKKERTMDANFIRLHGYATANDQQPTIIVEMPSQNVTEQVLSFIAALARGDAPLSVEPSPIRPAALRIIR